MTKRHLGYLPLMTEANSFTLHLINFSYRTVNYCYMLNSI